MSRITSCLVLVLLALCLAVSAQTLGPIDCKKVTTSGGSGKHTFNFAALQAATATPFKVADNSGNQDYEFAVCNNFNCNGAPTSICQEASNGQAYPCGIGFTSSTPATWTKKSVFFPKGAVTWTFAANAEREATITVICDPKAGYVHKCPLTPLSLFLSPVAPNPCCFPRCRPTYKAKKSPSNFSKNSFAALPTTSRSSLPSLAPTPPTITRSSSPTSQLA